MSARGRGVIALGAAALVVAVVVAPLLGGRTFSPARALAALADPSSPDGLVLCQLRIPRVALAMLVGAALSLAGMALQALTRNGLASEYTLGVASGSALGAVIALRLGLDVAVLGLPVTSVAALAGAGVVSLLVMGWAMRGAFDSGSLLLAGVTLGAIASAGILLVQYLADATQSHLMVRWLMGGFDVVGHDSAVGISPFLLSGGLLVLLHVRELDQLLQGDDLAAVRGVAVRRVRGAVIAGVALLTGSAVSVAGPIGFVGLIVPHSLRLLVGPSHRVLAPACALWGAVFLATADTAARAVLAPAEIPVGVLTALLGGPFFLWVLGVRRRRWRML
jgi:iron complex transport system permease protein